MHGKCLEKFVRAFSILRMKFEPGIDERSNQPGPNRALMISAVTRTQVAGVNRFVFGIVGRKRTQPHRRDQFLLHNIDNRRPSFLVEHGMIERDGEELIWPARSIVRSLFAVAIDHVVKITTAREPEAIVERFSRTRGVLVITFRGLVVAVAQPISEQAKR